VVHDTLSARIAPRRTLDALMAALAGRRVRIDRTDTPPDGATAVVWATGARGLQSAGLGGPQKGQAALLLAPDWRDAPQISAPGLHIVPHEDGNVAIGSTSESSFADPESTDAQLDAVIARARALCPALSQAPVVTRWAGLRPRAASRQPVLGPLPDGAFILNGGFKIGFGLAPLLARMMADLLLDGADRIPADWRADRA
jgi:glycine oxidase